MFKAVYRPSTLTKSNVVLLGTPFKEELPGAANLRQAFEQGRAGERAITKSDDGFTVGRVFVGLHNGKG
jgi:hypothetical protein